MGEAAAAVARTMREKMENFIVLVFGRASEISRIKD
jgi:hypothetical protein